MKISGCCIASVSCILAVMGTTCGWCANELRLAVFRNLERILIRPDCDRHSVRRSHRQPSSCCSSRLTTIRYLFLLYVLHSTKFDHVDRMRLCFIQYSSITWSVCETLFFIQYYLSKRTPNLKHQYDLWLNEAVVSKMSSKMIWSRKYSQSEIASIIRHKAHATHTNTTSISI